MTTDLQYPVGKFQYGKNYTPEDIKQLISRIESFPRSLVNLLNDMPKEKMFLTYRKGAWTGLQLVNHFIDVYINAYLRTKWLLTEEGTTLKPYDQDACSLLPDSNYPYVEESLQHLAYLIRRWVYLLKSLDSFAFEKKIFHPEYELELSLSEMIAAYEWHARHHLAHLMIIKNA
ncbi:MAG TPA: putative metal-dependent hydrolase [Chitinophagaceae bacterium]|nr:putative metal-dependent hydrolase [Chitinophagaceae bacterium]